MNRWTWLAAIGTWLAGVCHASAVPPHVHLIWEHPVGSMCPSAATLESDVEQLDGQPIFSASPDAEIIVRGSVEDLPTGVHAHLEVSTADGTLLGIRELSAPAGECASLRRALALVLTLLLENDARASQRRGEHPLHGGVGAAALSGLFPRFTPGVELAIGVDVIPPLRMRGGATYWLPASIETERGTGATLQAVALDLSLCPRVSGQSRWLQVWLCAGSQLGGLLSAPRGLTGPERQVRLLAQASVELKLSFPIGGKFRLEAAAGSTASLSRPRFYYVHGDRSVMQVHRPAPIGAIFRLTFIMQGR